MIEFILINTLNKIIIFLSTNKAKIYAMISKAAASIKFVNFILFFLFLDLTIGIFLEGCVCSHVSARYIHFICSLLLIFPV